MRVVGGCQSGGNEGTRSSGRGVYLQGGTIGVVEGTWVMEHLVFITVVGRGSFVF